MVTRKLVYTIASILILGLLATSSTGAFFNDHRTEYLTFTGPIHLPGVTLGPGTYTFELPLPQTALNLVRVSSRDGKHVYLTAFTTMVERPRAMPRTQSISFGESPAHLPAPIKAWYPPDETTGRQFIY